MDLGLSSMYSSLALLGMAYVAGLHWLPLNRHCTSPSINLNMCMGCCQCAKPTNPGQISVLEWNPIATSFHLLPWRPLGNTMEGHVWPPGLGHWVPVRLSATWPLWLSPCPGWPHTCPERPWCYQEVARVADGTSSWS